MVFGLLNFKYPPGDQEYWCEEVPGRRICKNCERKEVLWGNDFAEGFVPDYWEGGKVKNGQCFWHQETTDARNPKDFIFNRLLDVYFPQVR